MLGSGAMSTTNGTDRVVDDNNENVILGDVGTTKGDLIADPTKSGKLDPPAY